MQQLKTLDAATRGRLEEDAALLESLLEGGQEDGEALSQLESRVTARAADIEALATLAARVDGAAPGPEASRLRRDAEKLGDDWRNLDKRVRNAAKGALRKVTALSLLILCRPNSRANSENSWTMRRSSWQPRRRTWE